MPVWRGFIDMFDVAKSFITTHEVSGCANGLEEELAGTLDIVGCISPEKVWDYISEIKKSVTKETVVVRMSAINDPTAKNAYESLYKYLCSRHWIGVVDTSQCPLINHFYIMPLSRHSPVPQVLLPLDGPGLEESRSHFLLLGIIIRTRGKRPANLDMTGHSVKSASSETLQMSDWRSGKWNQKLSYLLESKLLTDCTFILGPDDDTQEVKAHKLILSSCSPVFHTMFYGALAETSHIRVTDVTKEAFKFMLKHIYNEEELQIKDMQTAVDVCYTAIKYDIHPLVAKCTSYIVEYMTLEEVFPVLHFAEGTDILQLKQTCIEMIQTCTTELLNSAAWLDAEESSVLIVLQQDWLSVENELPLIDACVHWAQHNSKRGDIRELMCPLLAHLRVLSLTAKQFIQATDYLPLSGDEKFAILSSIIVKDNNAKLPDGFCRVSTTRYNTANKNVNLDGIHDAKNYKITFHYQISGSKCVSKQSMSFMMNESRKLYSFVLSMYDKSTFNEKFKVELRQGTKCLLRYNHSSNMTNNNDGEITITCQSPCYLQGGQIYSFHMIFARAITCPQLSHKKEQYDAKAVTVKDKLDSSLCNIVRMYLLRN